MIENDAPQSNDQLPAKKVWQAPEILDQDISNTAGKASPGAENNHNSNGTPS